MSGPADVLAVLDALATQRRLSCVMPIRAPRDPIYTKAVADLKNAEQARAAIAELIEAAINVHAACRAGKEPDLIALADALDATGAKDARKVALARVTGDTQ